MGKKKKKAKVGATQKGERTALILGGAILAIVAYKLLTGAADKFTNGLSYKFSNVKVKLKGLSLTVTGKLTVTNTNSIGVNVNGFNGFLKFGRDGQQIVPITVAPFKIAPKAESSGTFTTSISMLNLGANIISVVTSIANGQYKKLWISGSLKTSLINIPVETEVSLLSE